MKKIIFENKAHPFTVPDGYFDDLQERIMCRIQAEENHTKGLTSLRITPFRLRAMVAAAACILFIFAGVTLYMNYPKKQSVVTGLVIEDDFYQWLYASDEATLMAESLNIQMPENIITSETALSEEEEAIIHFLERDNINVAAILHSINN
jgi:hypothetical protein